MNLHKGSRILSTGNLFCFCLQLVLSASLEVPCSEGWTTNKYSGSCNKVIRGTRKTYTDARAFCRGEGGDLLKILDEKSNEAVRELIKHTRSTYLIGLRKKSDTSNISWLDETEAAEYVNWHNPRTRLRTKWCAKMNYRGKWIPEPCADLHPLFICEKREVDLCPPLWIPSASSGTCIKLYRNAKSSWEDARAQCMSIGGDLVTVLDAAMNHFLWEISPKTGYYIGLHDMVDEGYFHWLNYRDNVSYTNWDKAKGQPDDKNGSQNCAMVNLAGATAEMWSDVDCNMRLSFVCETYADCEKEKLGMVCPKVCSPHCVGNNNNTCNPRTAVCNQGCDPGYTGATCPPNEDEGGNESKAITIIITVTAATAGLLSTLVLLLWLRARSKRASRLKKEMAAMGARTSDVSIGGSSKAPSEKKKNSTSTTSSRSKAGSKKSDEGEAKGEEKGETKAEDKGETKGEEKAE